MHQHINRFVYYCDKDGSVLSQDTVPFEPAVAIMNEWRYSYGQKSDWSGFTDNYSGYRILRTNNMFYPVYVVDAARYDKNLNWREVDGFLNNWSNQDELCAGLGKAFLVIAAKISLYLFRAYPQYLEGPRGNSDWRHNNEDVYFNYKNGRYAFEQMAQMICQYLGVTYRPSGNVRDSYGLLYFPSSELANEVLYSLAYALWYDYDGARNRWRVNWDYVNKYGGLYSADYPNTSLYEGLTDSFHTYDEILELTDRFRRQY